MPHHSSPPKLPPHVFSFAVLCSLLVCLCLGVISQYTLFGHILLISVDITNLNADNVLEISCKHF